ncbi:MAG: hypothetical protein J0L77_02910 [Alphaproteobacteria bacterium]|nr:hypothetical protein [Alphaproteobacteria bacterium]
MIKITHRTPSGYPCTNQKHLLKWRIWIAISIVVVAAPALFGSFEISVQTSVKREAPHILRAFPKSQSQ